MSTVDEAVEAGARALYELDAPPSVSRPWAELSGMDHWTLRQDGRAAISAAWPVLSAGLRELHEPVWVCGNPRHTNPVVGCPDCVEVCRTCAEYMPCPTVAEFDWIDQELGIGDDHHSGDPSPDHGYGDESDCLCGRNFATVRGLREHMTKQRKPDDPS